MGQVPQKLVIFWKLDMYYDDVIWKAKQFFQLSIIVGGFMQ